MRSMGRNNMMHKLRKIYDEIIMIHRIREKVIFINTSRIYKSEG